MADGIWSMDPLPYAISHQPSAMTRSASHVRGDRTVLHDADPNSICVAGFLAVDTKAALAADWFESIDRKRYRGAGGVPARAVELEPHAVGRGSTRRRNHLHDRPLRARALGAGDSLRRRCRLRRRDRASRADGPGSTGS